MTIPQQPVRRRARPGTIVWGAILVGAAVFALLVTLGGGIDTSAVLWGIVGFGVVLIVAAIVTAVVRAVRGGADATSGDASTGEHADPEHPPIG